MDPIKTDKAFYHNLLIKNITLLLYISQCFGFLPYPCYVLQQHIERGHLRTWIRCCLNAVLSVLIFSISLICYLMLYMYYPYLIYKDTFPGVIRIMYHVESWLRVVLVLIALAGPRLSGRYFRETIDTLVHVMQLYDNAEKLQGLFGVNYITTNRLLLLYSCHGLVVSVTVWISTEHPISTLLNMSCIASYVIITVYTLLYQALLSSVAGIVACLNDTLLEVTLLEKNHPERSYEKHTTISYIRLHNGKQIQNHNQQVDVATFEKLSTLHLALMRLVRNGNKQFGVLMLVILLSSFVQTNILLIELYHNIRHPMLPEYSMWIYFLHALVHFSFFFVIAKTNHSIQQQLSHPTMDLILFLCLLQNERTMLLLHEFKCSWNVEQNMAVSTLEDLFQFHHTKHGSK
ncbi:uncharacterized protein LOC128712734 [Anopheles marshallii]|uniref:uncharacterized protein LOC128712734 n=1 Tax=Anopheles marshallii TaxID=1521116 RepID=UPI00237C0217|nr:uncharacterized protein LOC128712734 [Anopheles marshallii]